MTAYTLHSQGSYGLSSSGDSGSFTLGTEFEVSATVSLTGIWFYSGSGSLALPSACGIYSIVTTTFVPTTENTSPSWSGAAGSGWVKCSYSGLVSLVSGTKYVVAVFANSSSWFYDVASYWTTGAGSAGITNGPLSAPSSAAAVNGQAVFSGNGSITFPATTVSGFDFGVDVEVSTSGGTPHTATAAASSTPALVASPTRGRYRTASLTSAPARSAAAARGHSRGASLVVTPVTSAHAARGRYRLAHLTTSPTAAAAASAGFTATGSLSAPVSLTADAAHGHARAPALVVTPTAAAASLHGHNRSASVVATPALTAHADSAGSHSATASLLVAPLTTATAAAGYYTSAAASATPLMAAVRSLGRYRAASLSSAPAAAASRERGQYRAGSLTESPAAATAATRAASRLATATTTPALRSTAAHGQLSAAHLSVLPVTLASGAVVTSHVSGAALITTPVMTARPAHNTTASKLLFYISGARLAWLVQGARVS